MDPSFYWLYQSLAWGLGGQGKLDDAVEACRQALNLVPRDPSSQAFLGRALGIAGQHEEALTIVEDLERRRGEEYVGGVWLALAWVGLGDHDRAIDWLEKAAEDRDGLMVFINRSQLFDPLRADPRFHALLRRMNFPPASS